MLFQIFSLSDKGTISETKKKWISIFFLAFIAVATALEKSSDQKRMDDLTTNNKALLSLTDSTKLLVEDTKELAYTTKETTDRLLGINERLETSNNDLSRKVDSFSLVKEGVISITPGHELVIIDTTDRELRASLILCNTGNAPAKNVNIVVWKVNKQNSKDNRYISKMKADFSDGSGGQPDCWRAYYSYSKEHELRSYFICYKITYTDTKGLAVTEYKSVMYSYDLGKWAVTANDFSWVFSQI